MPHPSETPWDVAVLGAGPAGSTAAALLAREGHRVIVIEREVFPRFHIGESLLPGDFPTLARLGLDVSELPHVPKRGAEFIDERDGRRSVFNFSDGLAGSRAAAVHVERRHFDHWLLRNAQASGAEVRQGTQATAVSFLDDAVEVEIDSQDGTGTTRIQARYLVDATGQDALMAKRCKTRQPRRGFGKGAAYRHFGSIAPHVWETEILPRGDIRVLIIDDGWVWMIPIAERSLSVGVVRSTGKISQALLDEVIDRSPTLRRVTAGATEVRAGVISNFSFRNSMPHGPRFGCVGDASAFLDPVFSSGVTLAMVGAQRLAEELGPALDDGREADPDLMLPVAAHIDRGYAAFERMVDRFYNSNLIDNFLFAEDPPRRMREGFISVLAGDVWRDDNPFQALLMKAKRRPAAKSRTPG